jgi:hypothetical protein
MPIKRPRTVGKLKAKTASHRWIRLAMMIGGLFLCPLSATRADVTAALSGPVRVELTDGRSFSGRPVSFRDDILLLRTQLDGGEVERGFPRAQIRRMHFPGQRLVAEMMEMLDDGRTAEVLPHLEALWRQRAGFLALAEAETIELLAALPATHLDHGDAYRAIALARNLLPHARTPAVADRLHETILIGHYRLEFYDETEKLARDWIRAQHDFPPSALGWRILADLALREEDFAKVVWIALQPIATAGPESSKHLDSCYALAIHAFHKKKSFGRAAQLHREMLDRGLVWPSEETLAETGKFYQSLIPAESQRKADTPEPDLDLRPPEEDLNLPLEEIRKILRRENP